MTHTLLAPDARGSAEPAAAGAVHGLSRRGSAARWAPHSSESACGVGAGVATFGGRGWVPDDILIVQQLRKVTPPPDVQASLYLMVLTVNTLIAIERGFAEAPGELPLWGTLAVLTSSAVVVLLSHVRGTYTGEATSSQLRTKS